MIMQSSLQWYGRVTRQDINFQIQEVMELEIAGKGEEGSTIEMVGRIMECMEKDLDQCDLRREDAYDQEKW